jgi:hypothetical protein
MREKLYVPVKAPDFLLTKPVITVRPDIGQYSQNVERRRRWLHDRLGDFIKSVEVTQRA